MTPRTPAAAGLTLLLAAGLALAGPLAASAHVRVDPGQASPGGYTTLTFRVPNESATAGTVQLRVALPQDTPFTAVAYQPVPGWSAAVQTATLPKPVTIGGTTVTQAPTAVTWTADPGTQIGPGQFQQFAITAGPVPDTGRILLPAVQAYSDGTTVAWDQPPAAGAEPEHPAPVLYITQTPPPGTHGGLHATATPAPQAAEADPDGSNAAALAIGLAGLLLGAAGTLLAALALTRQRPRRG